ncbi:unnamed protein product [Auanema sp. JU1783]|nr:unnamed protein product [Auanema sp. JU1783]
MKVLFVLLVICLYCSVTIAQMTFTDQWTKKNVIPQQPERKEMICSSKRTMDAHAQLERIQQAQARINSYLEFCYQN